MPSFVPAKKNIAFTFYLSLISQANTKIAQANPTLAAGDAQVAIDDGAPANLATLPVVDADFTKRVKVAMSAAEMNGDNITIIFSDAAGAEWCDLTVNIQTAARLIDDLAFPNVSGRGVDVDATGGVEITANQAVNAAQWAGAATATDDVALATTPTNFSALSITAAGLVDITQAAADKVWSSATRTLTAFSTALAVSVWDVLETAIAVASSIGLKVKNNLDAAITSRFPATGGTLAKTTNITGFNDLSAAQVNAEVDTALDTAIPAVNTATSVNDVLLDVVNARLLGTVAAGTHNAQSGDGFARLGAPAGVSVSADIAAIEAQTDDIGVAGAGLTALGDTRIANLDATVSSRMATYVQPTGFLAATFPPDPADQSLIIAATDAIIADTNDIQTRLPAALVGGRVDSSVGALNGVATGAARIARSTQGITLGTVDVGSTTTSIVTSSLDPAASVADQFKGRIVTFEQGTATVALRGQSTDITASSAVGVLTVSALTTAPASGDVFVIT